jgi:hypothetical protein
LIPYVLIKYLYLKDHLGDTLSADEQPSWIVRKGSIDKNSLLALVCARDLDSSQRYDYSITNTHYFDVAYTNGHRVLWFGICVALKEFKADMGRFRWVGARALPRSGSWDDKVEHMIVDLWAKDEAPPVFIIKVTEFFPVAELSCTKEEETLLANALDQVTLTA